MSKQLDLDSGPFTEEEIADLYSKWPVEKVEYLVAEAKARAGEVPTVEPEPNEPEEKPYGEWSNDELKDELEKRGLVKSGNKDDMVARLENDDQERAEDSEGSED